jgi:hypothetical protein
VLCVAVASAPSTPTHAQRPWRALQNTPTDSAMYSDSEYTAEKKNAIGANATTSTARRAASATRSSASARRAPPRSSSVVRRWIPYSASANAPIDTSTPASTAGAPSQATARRASGYSG